MRFVGLASLAVLALIHVFTPRLRFLHGIPRSVWLSMAGGVSVSYVFMHLLPELAEGHALLPGGEVVPVDAPVFLTALGGLVLFYGLERLAKRSPHLERRGNRLTARQALDFWVHLGSFALYNAVTGYLLLQPPETGLTNLILFALALALHFIVVDFGLLEDYGNDYLRAGRILLVAALLAGGAVGFVTEVHEHVVVLLTAFLGGGIILNVLKEELPEERRSRFSAFLIGVALYTALLLYMGQA